MRVPGLTGKLDDSWEGPYEVVDKISPVNNQLAIPERAGCTRQHALSMACSVHGILQTLASSD